MIEAHIETEGRRVFVAFRDRASARTVTLSIKRGSAASLGAILGAAITDDGCDAAYELGLDGELDHKGTHD